MTLEDALYVVKCLFTDRRIALLEIDHVEVVYVLNAEDETYEVWTLDYDNEKECEFTAVLKTKEEAEEWIELHQSV